MNRAIWALYLAILVRGSAFCSGLYGIEWHSGATGIGYTGWQAPLKNIAMYTSFDGSLPGRVVTTGDKVSPYPQRRHFDPWQCVKPEGMEQWVPEPMLWKGQCPNISWSNGHEYGVRWESLPWPGGEINVTARVMGGCPDGRCPWRYCYSMGVDRNVWSLDETKVEKIGSYGGHYETLTGPKEENTGWQVQQSWTVATGVSARWSSFKKIWDYSEAILAVEKDCGAKLGKKLLKDSIGDLAETAKRYTFDVTVTPYESVSTREYTIQCCHADGDGVIWRDCRNVGYPAERWELAPRVRTAVLRKRKHKVEVSWMNEIGVRGSRSNVDYLGVVYESRVNGGHDGTGVPGCALGPVTPSRWWWDGALCKRWMALAGDCEAGSMTMNDRGDRRTVACATGHF